MSQAAQVAPAAAHVHGPAAARARAGRAAGGARNARRRFQAWISADAARRRPARRAGGPSSPTGRTRRARSAGTSGSVSPAPQAAQRPTAKRPGRAEQAVDSAQAGPRQARLRSSGSRVIGRAHLRLLVHRRGASAGRPEEPDPCGRSPRAAAERRSSPRAARQPRRRPRRAAASRETARSPATTIASVSERPRRRAGAQHPPAAQQVAAREAGLLALPGRAQAGRRGAEVDRHGVERGGRLPARRPQPAAPGRAPRRT